MGRNMDILEIYCVSFNSYTMKNGNVAGTYNECNVNTTSVF